MLIDLNNKISHYYFCDVAIDTLQDLNDSFCPMSLNESRTKPHRTKPHQLFSVTDKTPLFNFSWNDNINDQHNFIYN